MHNQPKETGPDSVTCTGNRCGDSDPHSSDFSGSRYCTSCSEREQKGKTGKPEAVWAAGRSAQGVPHGPRGGDSPAPHAVGLPFGRKAESRGELREKCGSHPGASASGLELRALETAVGGRPSPRVFWHTQPRSWEPASSLTGGHGPASQGRCEDWMKYTCHSVTAQG